MSHSRGDTPLTPHRFRNSRNLTLAQQQRVQPRTPEHLRLAVSHDDTSANLVVPGFALETVEAPRTPLTPSTPVILSFEDLQQVTQCMRKMHVKSSELHDKVRELNIILEQEKANNRFTPRRLEYGEATTPATPGHRSSDFVNGSGFLVRRPSIPATPQASVGTTGMRSSATNGYAGRGTGNSSRGRIHRVQTPIQTEMRALTEGQPFFTHGIQRQDDRGLIVDFFEEIKKWASEWAQQGSISAEDTLLLLPVFLKFLGTSDNVDAQSLLANSNNLRIQVVAGIIAQKIAFMTFSEHFLLNSGWDEAHDAELMIDAFNILGDGHECDKNTILLTQKAFYASVKNSNQEAFRALRESKAEQLAKMLLQTIHPLLSELPVRSLATTDRLYSLQGLFIRGFRIGFRMGCDAAKWKFAWPVAGEDFDLDIMVNETRDLHGSPLATYERISQAPNDYKVRFAMSPIIEKSVFATGVENKETIHKAMVHIEQKPNPIGSERQFFTNGFHNQRAA